MDKPVENNFHKLQAAWDKMSDAFLKLNKETQKKVEPVLKKILFGGRVK